MQNLIKQYQNIYKVLKNVAKENDILFLWGINFGEKEETKFDLPRVGSYSQMNRLVRNLTTRAVEKRATFKTNVLVIL